ncbi:minor capsid protein [Frisingicoccus sp.]|uniref:minor capsid protein n=1 Tax=Frisingicoccus sp. TaxID=1918627 RepID=UPI003AB242A7
MNYWTKRQEQLNKELEKDEEQLKKRLSSFYDTESRKLEKDIALYYAKYGTDNVIQYRTLMETLSYEDKVLLIQRMNEFAEKYPQYDYLMPVRESIYKLNRLEGLQYSVRMQQYEMGAITREELNKHLERQAMRGANAAAEAMGFGENFYANNPDVVKLFVDVPWSNGKNFSQRIWDNTEKLSNYLNTDIAQGFARGDSYARLTRQLKKRFGDASRNDAYRLIYTEGTYVMAESTMQPFTEDFEEYKISTVDDGKVCAICRGLAEKTFKIVDRKPGVNFPPLHTWCRCSFEIVVGDWDKWMDDYEKRHSNGQAQKVANRMDSGIIKADEDKIMMDLQFFAEKDIKNQESGSLKRAIRKYSKQIEEHENKISNPKEYIPDWDTYDVRYQEGLKRHWRKEIRNFNQSIEDRVDELKKRGDYDE